MADAPDRANVDSAFENLFERVLFGSRWLLAPLYAGLVAVMLTGYENVVSRLNIGPGERPAWLRKLDATGLKLRLFGSVAAISGIQVLRAFMDLSGSASKVLSDQEHASRQWSLQWMLITHGVFVLSGLAIALTERLAHSGQAGAAMETGRSPEPVSPE